MPGPYNSWLYIRDRSGLAFELINGARTKAYLSNPALNVPGIDSCQPFTGLACATWPYKPYLGPAIPGTITLPGTTGNYLSTPDAAALDITGDISIAAQIAPVSWTTGTQTIVSKFSTTSNFSYLLQLTGTGLLSFSWSTTGGDSPTVTSSVAVPGTVANTPRWVAVVFDANNGAAGRTAYFWYSTDGLNWTTVGTPQTSATATTIFAGTSPLFIGALSASSQLFNGKILNVQIRNITAAAPFKPGGGTLVFATSGQDITSAGASTYTATSGQTVTVNKSGSPQTTLTARVDCGAWQTQTFVTPTTDPAPWYNSAYPMSADALGFVVQDWTGLDDGHITRTSTPWGGYGGGATLAQIASAGRVMKVNLYLYGRSEEAVEYLFRWLGAALTGVCASCATETMLIRRYCGSTGNLWDGVAEMRNVGLIEGLKWEAEIQPEGNRYVRTASFALMAGDPCMYSRDSDTGYGLGDVSDLTPANLTACFAAAVPNPARVICRPSCSEVDSACRLTRAFTVNPLGATAPIVTWTNIMSQYSFPFRAVAYSDPGSVGPSNPCGLPVLGELYVRPLPPGASLRWDVVGRNVQYADETTGGWTSGWAYIEPNDPPKQRFFAVPCGKGYIVMEPASLCATFVGGVTWILDGITYNPPTYPTVSVSMGERLSCP